MRRIPIKTNKEKFFRQYLEFMNPFKDLRERERDVLALLLFLDDKMKELPEEVKAKLLLDYENRIWLREKLGIDEKNFNFILHGLRKKGVILNNQIHPLYKVYPTFPFELTFEFHED